MGEEVKLLRTWSSPFALRIVWALKMKGIDFETIYEDLLNKSNLLLELNPIYKKVPVLLHNGKPIVESLVILEYIEDTWKTTPCLLPEDAYNRSSARFWAKFGDDKVLPSLWAVFTTGKGQEDAINSAKENLKYLEQELKGKKFFGGETIGFVDIAFGWLANMVSVLEQVSNFKLIDDTNFPLLVSWMKHFAEVPIIKENFPDRDKMVEKFQAIHDAYLAKTKTT